MSLLPEQPCLPDALPSKSAPVIGRAVLLDACAMLKKDGFLQPVGFAIYERDGQDHLAIVPVEDKHDFRPIFDGVVAKADTCHVIAVAQDAWVGWVSTEDRDQQEAREAYMARVGSPSQDPDRKEAIVVLATDGTTVHTWQCIYEREETGDDEPDIITFTDDPVEVEGTTNAFQLTEFIPMWKAQTH